jgi:adenine phosphoribosyltransferase
MIDLTRVAAAIRDVPDFPSPGIAFKDISPLLADPGLFADVVAAMAEPFADAGVDLVAGIEARGFIVGAPVAQRLGAGFVPVRKAGKLPSATLAETYALEYGTATVEVHADAFAAVGAHGPARVLLVDDVLATGGTAAAAASLVARAGATAVGCAFLIELGFLDGRTALAAAHPRLPVEALLRL